MIEHIDGETDLHYAERYADALEASGYEWGVDVETALFVAVKEVRRLREESAVLREQELSAREFRAASASDPADSVSRSVYEQAVKGRQDMRDAYKTALDEVKRPRSSTLEVVSYDEQTNDAFDAQQMENNRLRRERAEALAVHSKEGLLASEWVARTCRAESETRQQRELLGRIVKYAREDRAETPGCNRLARVLEEVEEVLGGEP